MAEASGQSVGRYVLYDEIASGGMASVHMGRLIGPVGFSRVVAVKRLHPAYSKDPGFVAMLLDEARLASRVRHPNVVPILDVVATDDELLLVMEYVHGETLARLLRASKRTGAAPPPDIGIAIVIDILRGLHAAHEARNAAGEPLGIVHRDVSPQNILVATDGSARLLDFGVAKAISRSQSTEDGQLKGKLGYISPEQLSRGDVDRRVDVFATSIVAWECIAGRRLFVADDMVGTLARVMEGVTPSLREEGFDIPEKLQEAIERGLAVDPSARFQTAEDMAREVEQALRPASRERVGAWVEQLAGDALGRRLETMRRIETGDAEAGVVQVPVGISPDQSGKVPTLRASVGADVAPLDDQGTFPSTMATQSILPAEPSSKSWRRAALVLLALASVAAVVAAAFWHRTAGNPDSASARGGMPTPSSANGATQRTTPSAEATEQVVEPRAQTDGANETADAAVDGTAPSTADAAVIQVGSLPLESSTPRSSRPDRQSGSKPAKKDPTPAEKPAAPPVDPLVDQR